MEYSTDREPTLSVIVPVYNAEHTIERQLKALKNQNFDEIFEVIIVDNRSTDKTLEVASEFIRTAPNFRCVSANLKQGVSYARNTGFAKSRAQKVVFCDADDVVDANWLFELNESFVSGYKIVGGTLEYVTYDGRHFKTVDMPFQNGEDLLSPAGANCGVTKEVFLELGGFDENLVLGGEDSEFFWRAKILGYELGFNTSAKISYFQRKNMLATAKQFAKFGKSQWEIARKFNFEYGLTPNSLRALLIFFVDMVTIFNFLVLSPRARFNKASRLGRNWGVLQGCLANYLRNRTSGS